MKKILTFLFVMVVLAGWAWAGDFQVRLTGNLLLPGDSGYKDIYGKSVFYPELKAGYAFSGDFYVWAGYGFVNEKGETPVLKMAAESRQSFLSVGLGYGGSLSDSLGYYAELGLTDAFYKETAMDITESGSVLGFRADAGLTYAVSGPVFACLELGYISSSKEVNGLTIKPGGFLAGFGLGAKF